MEPIYDMDPEFVTDEDIKNCSEDTTNCLVDPYACERCMFKHRCFDMIHEKLSKIIDKNNK